MMRPLGGRERLHREGVNFFAHAVAQSAVDDLVTLNPRFSGEGVRHDDRLEMCAIAFDCKMFAIELFADIGLYCFWGNHGTVLNLVSRNVLPEIERGVSPKSESANKGGLLRAFLL